MEIDTKSHVLLLLHIWYQIDMTYVWYWNHSTDYKYNYKTDIWLAYLHREREHVTPNKLVDHKYIHYLLTNIPYKCKCHLT